MIFDLSIIQIDGVEHYSYKPRNRAVCNGKLLYKSLPIASVKHLTVCYTIVDEVYVVGGRFELEWYKDNLDINFAQDCLDLVIDYGEGKPPIPTVKWEIKNIAILSTDGVPLGIASIDDLMLGENIFFSTIFMKKDI